MGGTASGEGDDECDGDGDYSGSRTNRTHTLVLSRTSGTTAEQLAYRHTNSPAAFPVRKLGTPSNTNDGHNNNKYGCDDNKCGSVYSVDPSEEEKRK